MDVALLGRDVVQSREISESLDPGLSTDFVVRTAGSTDLLGPNETTPVPQQVRRAQPQDTQ
eukprot:946853-Prymnesium_polylepis.1